MKNFGFKKLMVFIVLSAAVALAYQLPYLRYTFYDQMTAAFGLNDTQMGLMATAVSLTSTICYPIGGFFADRFSMKKLICISFAAFVVLSALFAFTTDFAFLMVIHILFGFFGIATLWSAYLAGLRGLGDEETQSRLFGSSEATRGIIQMLTAFVFLALMNAALTPVAGFRTVMIAGTAICAVFLVLAIIFLPEEKKERDASGESTEEERFSIKDVLMNKGVWLTIWVVCCAYMAWSLGNGYLTTYTVRVLGVSGSLASSLGIVRSYIIVFLAGFLGGWVLDKFSYKGKGFLVLFSIVIVTTAGIMLTNKVVPVCVGLTILLAFLANVMKSTYWSVMGQAGIPVGMTAMATGIISFIAFIPEFIAPTVCGIWLDAATAAGDVSVGFNKIFIMIIAFAVAGLLGAVMLTRQTRALRESGAKV